MNRKGQGTIEYLVIIAIVVVIALVVVQLLLTTIGSFSGTSETSNKTAWASATPLAIIDYAQSGSTLTIVIKNTSGQTIKYQEMSVAGNTGSDLNRITTGVGKALIPGEEFLITGTTGTVSCSSGAKFSYQKSNIDINYSTPNINNLTQKGVADISGTCS